MCVQYIDLIKVLFPSAMLGFAVICLLLESRKDGKELRREFYQPTKYEKIEDRPAPVKTPPKKE